MAYDTEQLTAIEFLNVIIPNHDRGSCNDEDIFNGFGTHTGDGQWLGDCRRCMALQIINKDFRVPEGVDYEGVF